MYFRNKIHEQIYLDSIQNNPYKCTEQYLAALYILTSDKLLWRISRSKVKAKKIRFNAIRVYGTARTIPPGTVTTTSMSMFR